MTGKFVTEWQNVLSSSGADLKEVDVANGVSTLLAVKDSEELVRPFVRADRLLGSLRARPRSKTSATRPR